MMPRMVFIILSFICLSHRVVKVNKNCQDYEHQTIVTGFMLLLSNAPSFSFIFSKCGISIIGYANEVGEAFRPLIHVRWVQLSYGIAFAYVLADTADKTVRASRLEKVKDTYSMKNVVIAAGDTLIWQTLASIAIPGFTINRLCALSLYSLKKATKLSPKVQKWTTTAIGLACIPFIVTPIDRGVDHIMDKTIREWLK